MVERHEVTYLMQVIASLKNYAMTYGVSLERAIEAHEPPLSECVRHWIKEQQKAGQERAEGETPYKSLGNLKQQMRDSAAKKKADDDDEWIK